VLVFNAVDVQRNVRGETSKPIPIATSDHTAGNGVKFGSIITAPTINDLGEIAFRASSIEPKQSAGIASWLVSKSGAIINIAYKGMLAPDADGGTFDEFAFLSSNASGQAAFYGLLADDETAEIRNLGIWATRPYGALELVARSGEAAVGTNKVFNIKYHSFFGTQLTFKQSQQGHVAFLAEVIDPLGVEFHQYGVWREDTSGGLALVALDNEPVPGLNDGTTFRLMKNAAPFMRDNGKVAFRAYSSGPLESDEWKLGIWRENDDSTFRAVANVGDLLPGYGSPVYLVEIGELFCINNRGDTVFGGVGGLTQVPSREQRGNGIWLARGSSQTELIAMEGSPVPGIDSAWFTYLSSGYLGDDLIQHNTMLLNERGDTVFMGQFQGPNVTEQNDTGLWQRTADGTTKLIVREGDLAPNGKLFTDFLPEQTSMTFNNLGQVSFLQEARDAIWAYDHKGTITLIAEVGQAVDVDPGVGTEFRTFGRFRMLTASSGADNGRSGLNDQGQIAFYAELSGSYPGIFLSNAVAVPEPASAAIIAALALGWVVFRPLRQLKAS
jgi:hypothetical protein